LADVAVDSGSEVRMMQTPPPLKAHGILIPELEARRKEIVENRRQLRLAESQLPRFEQGVERARLEDTRAGVRARREGKKDPGPKNEMKAQADRDRLRREIAVLEGLDVELTNEAYGILREHGEEIIQALDDNLKELNDTQLAALAQVAATRSQRLQLQSVLGQVSASIPQPEAQATGGDYSEVLVHRDPGSVLRVDENEVKKVLAHLRAEAGDTGQRDQIAAQENPVADVFFPGAAGMAVARGRSFFEQRRAERAASAAETNGQGHDG
jgi:hypothetical protein